MKWNDLTGVSVICWQPSIFAVAKIHARHCVETSESSPALLERQNGPPPKSANFRDGPEKNEGVQRLTMFILIKCPRMTNIEFLAPTRSCPWKPSGPATSYKAAYYLAEGFPPENIVCRRLNKEPLRDFYYSDPALEALQINFLLGRAHVNPPGFRRCHGELASQAGRIKREQRKKSGAAFAPPS